MADTDTERQRVVRKGGRVWQTERQRQRDRDRETERQRDRETERDGETEKQRRGAEAVVLEDTGSSRPDINNNINNNINALACMFGTPPYMLGGRGASTYVGERESTPSVADGPVGARGGE